MLRKECPSKVRENESKDTYEKLTQNMVEHHYAQELKKVEYLKKKDEAKEVLTNLIVRKPLWEKWLNQYGDDDADIRPI